MDAASKDRNNKRNYLIGFIVGLIIFVPSLVIAKHHSLTGFQLTVFHDVNNWSDSLKTPALWITEGLGAGYAIAACILVSLILKYYRLAWRFFITIGGAGVVMEIAKQVTKEPRPAALLHGNNLHLRAVENGLNGFPSGHVTVTTAMALTLWLVLPRRWRWLSVVWILIVGVSRLYLGVHTPNDIIGGFSIGLAAVCFLEILPQEWLQKLHLGSSKLLVKNKF
ncbi:MAG TPA: phosphatase PAP2 family protein [Candidatus Saccharimonadales bacterium]|nr:phosphatase PAP2 family protein [Candidatus Saccharimonadales bacterium]